MRHRRKFTADGPFWGGVLALIAWGSTMTVILYYLTLRTP